MTQIKPLGAEFEEYLRDESRSVGSAQTISFPTCEDEIRSVLRKLYPAGTPITVQGSRTGLAGGAVPAGGHVMNLSRACSYLGLRRDDAGVFYLRVQPGVVLSELRKHLTNKSIPTHG